MWWRSQTESGSGRVLRCRRDGELDEVACVGAGHDLDHGDRRCRRVVGVDVVGSITVVVDEGPQAATAIIVSRLRPADAVFSSMLRR